ncbi:hypothetical protein SASPL_115054 [Salvia splendens]|uniref:phosphoethanolamine N-methyltransferase n=1 Tax=Salvia splendens TaxID=180675 RepID=A0A8X8Y7M2_SALSN|nr:hypothetical protein SASPL_115054 [Salvia splendens]
MPLHLQLLQVFIECDSADNSGNSFELYLIGCKCIGAYVKNKKNQNQVTIFAGFGKKVTLDNDRKFQKFLDTVQYKCSGILQGYVSTGGLGIIGEDKPALFKSFYKLLKPEGKVLISDYCRNSAEFAEYIKQRGYDLHDVKAYGHVTSGINEI